MLEEETRNKFYRNLFCKKTGCRGWGELFVSAYLLLMFGVYPFYMKQGYVDIGEAKYDFFIYCALAAVGFLGTVGIIRYAVVLLKRIKRREPYLICWENLSATDLFVILYATEIFISYVLSDYRWEALWGTEGWHIGLVPLLVLCALYFLISRFWDGKAYVWYVGMAASAVVFVLGILDRFSIYLIPLEIRQPAFISTLGNINWFCGYLTVIAPIGAYIFLFWERGEANDGGHPVKWKKWLAGEYVVTAFMAGFCQGGSSVFLFFAALFYLLLWKAVEKRKWLADYCFLVFLWGLSAQLVRVMRWLLPGKYNYDTDNLCAYLTDSNVTLAVLAAAFCLYLWIKDWDFTGKWSWDLRAESAHKILGCILAGGIFVWIALTVFNTWKGTISFPGGEMFVFDETWGNGRGAALKAGVHMYGRMPFINKIFGIGPDCFSVYAYSLPETAGMLRESFGGDRLTNAHNELLTCLVNTGIAGVILYLGIFISFIVRHLKKGTFISHMAIICILCYFIHNMVSFAQVLNLPFVFLIMAMGEGKRNER